MLKPICGQTPPKAEKGFNITEVTVAAALIGTLSSIAFPNYIASQQRSRCSETRATLVSIPPIISAYIDATGEAPSTWEDLTNIAAVMTRDGPASGNLNNPITLPRTNYELSIEGPSESTYSLTANCYIKTQENNPGSSQEQATKNDEKHIIRSCFNVSNGASDITSGSSTDPANTPNCG